MKKKEYYIWNGEYAGNSLVFWRDQGGYTPNVEQAEMFTAEDAREVHVDSQKVVNRRQRLTDWP